MEIIEIILNIIWFITFIVIFYLLNKMYWKFKDEITKINDYFTIRIRQLKCNHSNVKIINVYKQSATNDSFYYKVKLECRYCNLQYNKSLIDLNFEERLNYIKWRKEQKEILKLKQPC